MADTFVGLADLVKLNDKNVNDLGVSDLFDDAPALQRIFATVASNGTKHSYLKQTTAGSAAFRAVNAGISNGASADTQVDITLKLLDASFDVDMALAMSYYKGADAFIAREAKRALKQAMFMAEKQVF